MPVASVASEVAAVVADELFWDLDGPVVRVAPPNAYVPFAAILEDAYLPQVEDVVEAVQKLAAT
ncbi:MAG: transketolase C-terminal domain-containing protein, partial [Acidimicrobiia bacterium]